jgi:hypothetical protein
MRKLLMSFVAIALVACSSKPSQGDVETAIAQTQEAKSTEISIPHTTKPPSPKLTDTLTTKIPNVIVTKIITLELPTNTAQPSNTPLPTNTPKPTSTPKPTNTPEPTATLTPPPVPVTFTGSGDSIVDISAWPATPGLIIVEGNAGGVYFGVIPYDKDGNRMSSIVNKTDVYKGICPFNFDGQYVTRLEIKATGSWTINIVPLSQARTLSVPGKIEGSGDDVIVLTGATPDIAAITGNSSGVYFGVIPYSADAHRMSSMVNETDVYQGTVIVPRDTAILEFRAEGNWSIDITAAK